MAVVRNGYENAGPNRANRALLRSNYLINKPFYFFVFALSDVVRLCLP
jgi:hypothetical protein